MAFEKVEKDLLFDDIVWKDAKRYLREHYPAKDHLLDDILIPVLLIPAFFILFLTHCAWYGWLGFLLPVAYSTFRIAAVIKKQKEILNGGYIVDKDTLVSVSYKWFNRREVIILNFKSSADWEVPYDNYKWSKTYRLTRKGVANTSLQGDTFWIVRLKSSYDVVVAYNTKFFDYKNP